VLELSALTPSATSITYGVLKPGPFCPHGTPLLQIEDVIHGDIDTSSLHRISDALDAQYARTRLMGGDIVISLVGTVGRVARIPSSLEGANLHRNLGLIRISHPHSPEYVLHFLRSRFVRRAIERVTFGSTQPLFNLTNLRTLLVLVPEPREQERIAEAMDEFESRMVATETHLQKLLNIKNSLIQYLISGQSGRNGDA